LFFRFPFLFQSRIIGKQVKLLKAFGFCSLCFVGQTICSDSHTADQKIGIYNAVIKFHDGIRYNPGGGSLAVQVGCSVGMFGRLSSVTVCCDFSVVLLFGFLIRKIVNVVSDSKRHLVCDKSFFHKTQNKQICHFPHDQLSLFGIVWALQDLTGADAF
jgi:hypothetical protein